MGNKSYDKILELFTNVYRSHRNYIRLANSDMDRNCYTFNKALDDNIQYEKELENFLYNKLGFKIYSSTFKYVKFQDHTEIAYKTVMDLLKKLVKAEREFVKTAISYNNKETDYNHYIKYCKKFDEAVFNVESVFNNLPLGKNNINLSALRV